MSLKPVIAWISRHQDAIKAAWELFQTIRKAK